MFAHSSVLNPDPLSLTALFFFKATATAETYTLSLHDALPISICRHCRKQRNGCPTQSRRHGRSEEHTSELQSRGHLVCRLLLEKKNSRRREHQRARYGRGHVSRNQRDRRAVER